MLVSYSQEPVTSIKQEEGQTKEVTKFIENVEITDPKLRADGGSLSKYGLKFNLTYNGPTLGNLEEKDQPNLDGTVGSYQTAIAGAFGFRYRYNSKTSLGISTGVRLIYPFHGMGRTDLSNPSITADYSFKRLGIQMKSTTGYVVRTVPDFTRVGQIGMIYENLNLVYDFGLSPYAIGLDLAMGVFFYDRGYEASDRKTARHSLELAPNFKYRFNDRWIALTSLSFYYWNQRKETDYLKLSSKIVYQKMGFSYNYSRDIYINPHLQFTPDRFAWDRTSLNVSAIFSVI